MIGDGGREGRADRGAGSYGDRARGSRTPSTREGSKAISWRGGSREYRSSPSGVVRRASSARHAIGYGAVDEAISTGYDAVACTVYDEREAYCATSCT